MDHTVRDNEGDPCFFFLSTCSWKKRQVSAADLARLPVASVVPLKPGPCPMGDQQCWVEESLASVAVAL